MWSEKYRPRNFRDLICNEDAVFVLYKILQKIGAFNILLQGPSGIGKNSSAFSFLNELSFQKSNYHLIELNGTDESRIKYTKEMLANFIETNFSNNITKKIVVIKNSDFLSFQNQLCLRKYLENNSSYSCFWLICKLFSKINTSILSRCIRIVLKKQGFLQPAVRLKEIVDKENMLIFLETLENFISIGNFNFRIFFNSLTQNFFLTLNHLILSIVIKKNLRLKLI